jgi:hypothetical protein
LSLTIPCRLVRPGRAQGIDQPRHHPSLHVVR